MDIYTISRRKFLRWSAALFSFILSGCIDDNGIDEEWQDLREVSTLEDVSKVYVIKTSDRISGVNELLARFELDRLSAKNVALKANFNSADTYPASTHIETLAAVVEALHDKGAEVVLAERSGMGDTRNVLEKLGVIELSEKMGFEVVVLDELKTGDWETIKAEHWSRGFLFPTVFSEADAVVQTCCLKTHRYGGHFTMSLKNSVGMVAKYDPAGGYNYMSELHTSRYQRHMIAEINTAYSPEVVIMDGIRGFSKGGPDTGTLIEPGIMMASRDRIALDAAGIAVLRLAGTTSEVARGRIFSQDQIARAVELGLGASGPGDIEIIPINDQAQDICSRVDAKLRENM